MPDTYSDELRGSRWAHPGTAMWFVGPDDVRMPEGASADAERCSQRRHNEEKRQCLKAPEAFRAQPGATAKTCALPQTRLKSGPRHPPGGTGAKMTSFPNSQPKRKKKKKERRRTRPKSCARCALPAQTCLLPGLGGSAHAPILRPSSARCARSCSAVGNFSGYGQFQNPLLTVR